MSDDIYIGNKNRIVEVVELAQQIESFPPESLMFVIPEIESGKSGG